MKWDSHEEALLKRYLLGAASAVEQEQVEAQLLRSDEAAEQFVLLEEELIDDYARGALPADEQAQFEQYFLATAKRRAKLEAAQDLVRYASQPGTTAEADANLNVDVAANEQEKPAGSAVSPANWVRQWWQGLFAPWWKVAVAAVLVLGLGIGFWRWRVTPSEIEQGMLALNQAYREQRTLKARLTGLDYAPFTEARGNESGRVDLRARDRAERILLDSVAESPKPSAHHALGRLYLTQHKFEQAINEFELALKTEPNNAQLHSDLGAALLEKSRQSSDQQRRALEIGRSLDELNRAVSLNPALLEAIFNRALSRELMGLTSQAEEGWREYLQKDQTSLWAEEARQRLRELEQQKKKVARRAEGQYEDFLAAYRTGDEAKAWEAFKSLRNRQGNALSDRLLAEWLEFVERGSTAEARQRLQLLDFAGNLELVRTGDRYTAELAAYYHQKASRHIETLKTARQTMNEAATLYDQSKLQAALELYLKAAALFRSADNEVEAYLAESWHGYCLMRLDNTTDGLALFERLQAVYQQRGYHSLEAYALDALADAHFARDEFSRAIERTNQSLQLARETEDWACQLRGFNILGVLERMLGRYEESMALAREGIAIAEQQNTEPRQSWGFYSSIAINLSKLGYTQAALDAQQEAQRLARQTGWPLYQSLSAVRQGLLYAELGRFDESLSYATQALVSAQEIADLPLRKNTSADVLFTRGELLRRAGRVANALASYEQARALYASSSFQLFSYQAQTGCFLARLALNDTAGAAKDLAGARQMLENYRSQILEESYRGAFFADEQEFYDAAIEFAYQHKRDVAEAYQLAESSRARALLDTWQRKSKIVRRGETLELQAASLANPLALSEIQRRLPAHTQVLHYAVLGQRVIGWVIRRDSFGAVEQAIPLQTLAPMVRRFVELLALSDPRATREVLALAGELHRLLIEPLEGQLHPQELLCIVPDKELHFLPFAALRSGPRAKYLIEDYPLVIAPSSTAFVLCSEQAAIKKVQVEKLLCFGNPALADEVRVTFADLPAAQQEAEQVAALYGAAPLIGTQAKESVFKSLAGQADVIHIAGHALADPRSPLLSRLFFSPDAKAGLAGEDADGLLHAYELYQLRLTRPRLVVLSACQTGTGRLYQGEGVHNLARPWLAAGVPVVVASLWQVDSSRTRELMVRFHQQRKRAGLAVAQALRASQLEMLAQQGSQSAHPASWASFAVIGGATTY